MLEKIGYDQHKWFICVGLKMVNFLLGQQSGFTKCPCFLCMWDSRDRAQHYTKKDWPLQEELVPFKERNVINDSLVNRERILFPLLRIKHFTKALDKDDDCFTYLCQAFTGLTMEKLKAGIFDGPQIQQLIRDPEFKNSMNEVELEAWKAFVLIVKKFLGNNEATNYAELVNMLITFRNLGCNICCWQNIFSLKNIFRIKCVDKNQQIMSQKFDQLSKDLNFFKSNSQKTLT